MSVDAFAIYQLAAQGFCCSQILVQLGLGEDSNPALLRAANGLCGGMGRSGKTCGALTGGVCLIGLKAGKGTPTEMAHPKLNTMINELLEWFEQEYKTLDCAGIIDVSLDSGNEYPVKCGSIVSDTYLKVMQILADNHDADEDEEED